MKKIALLLSVLTLLAALALPFGAVELDKIAEAEVYEVASLEPAYGSLRSMSVDPEGKYAYCGQINASGIVHKIDLTTGENLWRFEADNGWAPKLVAADDRGNVFVGLTNPDGKDARNYIAVLDAETGEMRTAEPMTFTYPANPCSFNGGNVFEKNGNYYLYTSANYGEAYILCFDVTDINDIVLNADFGENGICDVVKVCGVPVSDYGVEGVSIDKDGSLWACVNFKGSGKGDALAHISADGKKMLGACKDDALVAAFSCCPVGDDLIAVVNYNAANSSMTLVDKASLTVKETGLLKYANVDNYTVVNYVNGEFYIANQANFTLVTTDKAFYHDPNVDLAQTFIDKMDKIPAEITEENYSGLRTKILAAENSRKQLTEEAIAMIDPALFTRLEEARAKYDELAAAAAESEKQAQETAAPETQAPSEETQASGSNETGKTEEPTDGANVGLIVGIIAAVVVIAAIVVVVLFKKKKN